MRRVLVFVILGMLFFNVRANAQAMSADKDAMYLAVIKAVANYKINDEENIRGVERLRQDQRFNEQLIKMMEQLDNSRTKDGKNRRILKILEKAGKDIYDILK